MSTYTEQMAKSKFSSVLGATFNFVNTVLGSGVFLLPFTIKKTGFFLGLILLLVVCLIQIYISIEMVRIAKKKNVETFEDLSKEVAGRSLYHFTCVFCALFSFGALIFYIQLIYGVNSNLLALSGIKYQNYYSIVLTVGIAVFVILPLCMQKDLSKLSYTSIISIVVFQVIFVILIITAVQRRPDNLKTRVDYDFVNKQFFGSVGSLSFSFVCTDSILPIYKSLKHKTMRNWTRVTYYSLGFIGMLYAVFIVVFFSLVPDLAENVIDNETFKSVQIHVARVLLSLTITLTFPMSFFCTRGYIFAIIKDLYGEISIKEANLYHYVFTVIILSVIVLLGITIGDVILIVDLTGLLASTFVGSIIPVIIILGDRTLKKTILQFCTAFKFSKPLGIKKRCLYFSNLILPLFIWIFASFCCCVGVPVTIMNAL